MGGRGASSGSYSRGGVPYQYGDEYRTLYEEGNIKFVAIDDRHSPNRKTAAPLETRTAGRIYATVNRERGGMHSISVMGDDGRVETQIDYQDHKGLGAHAHHWEHPSGNPMRGGAEPMNERERRLYNRVNEIYRKHKGRMS